MSKELKAFELLCRFLVEEINTLRHKDLSEDYFYNKKYGVTMTDKKTGIEYTTADIADALKNYESCDKERMLLIEEKHFLTKECLKIGKEKDKLKKALEIIKTKKVDIKLFLISEDCELYNMKYGYEDLIQEEFDLLKEVLL